MEARDKEAGINSSAFAPICCGLSKAWPDVLEIVVSVMLAAVITKRTSSALTAARRVIGDGRPTAHLRLGLADDASVAAALRLPSVARPRRSWASCCRADGLFLAGGWHSSALFCWCTSRCYWPVRLLHSYSSCGSSQTSTNPVPAESPRLHSTDHQWCESYRGPNVRRVHHSAQLHGIVRHRPVRTC